VSTRNRHDRENIRRQLDRWFNEKAALLFARKLDQLLTVFKDQGFSPGDIKVKHLESRWGSCSIKGRITLNSGLVKMDEKFSEYVILHELCHLKHHDHGKEFYRLLSCLMPDYKTIRNELKRYTSRQGSVL
jgi:hypothetical protein